MLHHLIRLGYYALTKFGHDLEIFDASGLTDLGHGRNGEDCLFLP